jgi:hypothetical protein
VTVLQDRATRADGVAATCLNSFCCLNANVPFSRCDAKFAALRVSKCKRTRYGRSQDSQPAPSTCTCHGYCSGLRPDVENYEHVYSVLFVITLHKLALNPYTLLTLRHS